MITKKLINKFDKKFKSDKTNMTIKNSISKVGINDASFNNEVLRRHTFEFSNKTDIGKITNQKQSGRCWMFSALNAARVTTIKKLKVENIEFSQNYTLFWDKLEKANYFLDSIIKTKKEKLNSRIVFHLLQDPVQDGGQWDMFKALLDKYGVVPKSIMPETFHSSNTNVMNSHITHVLRNYAKLIRENQDVDKLKEDCLYDVYNILIKCLGQPPQKFTFDYRDKDKKFHRISDITAKEFFKKYVGWNLKNMVSLIHAPTKDKEYYKSYTIKYLGSVLEADKIKYINIPIDKMKEIAIKSIKDGSPVWFGCDMAHSIDRTLGIMDLDIFDTNNSLVKVESSKASRLDYSESLLHHAMVFNGVNLNSQNKPTEWMVENSWGEKAGNKGIFSMSDEWFSEYNYEIMVDKKYLDKEILKVLDQESIELEPWDPFGALARLK